MGWSQGGYIDDKMGLFILCQDVSVVVVTVAYEDDVPDPNSCMVFGVHDLHVMGAVGVHGDAGDEFGPGFSNKDAND